MKNDTTATATATTAENIETLLKRISAGKSDNGLFAALRKAVKDYEYVSQVSEATAETLKRTAEEYKTEKQLIRRDLKENCARCANSLQVFSAKRFEAKERFFYFRMIFQESWKRKVSSVPVSDNPKDGYLTVFEAEKYTLFKTAKSLASKHGYSVSFKDTVIEFNRKSLSVNTEKSSAIIPMTEATVSAMETTATAKKDK